MIALLALVIQLSLTSQHGTMKQEWMNIPVASAKECNFCDLNFFDFSLWTLSKSQTLIILDKTFAVALTQVLKLWLINVPETLSRSAMSSFRSPRCISINVIRNSSCLVSLQTGPLFLFKFDLISFLLGLFVDFALHHFHATYREIKIHKLKNVDNLGVPV